MIKSVALITLLVGFFARVSAQHPPVFDGIITDTTYIMLNDLQVNLVKYSYREPTINFLVIHDDEDTGVKAGFEFVRFSGGTLLDCQYGGVRNYKFNYEGKSYLTDPNSIYTSAGIPVGLEKLGESNPEVIKQLAQAAQTILHVYSAQKPEYVFTLHNNGDGGFGIASYLEGYELENAADSLYINFQMDPDDMILVTELELFNNLKKKDVNVVLQSKDATDDGSLSIYAMKNSIPYVNVEVQHGHQEEHLRLIEIAIKALKEIYPERMYKSGKS
jgi:hypothetical protein